MSADENYLKRYCKENKINRDDLISPMCEECVLESIIQPEYKTEDVLTHEVPKDFHSSNLILEEICGKDFIIDGHDSADCPMKKAARRYHISSDHMVQFAVMRKYQHYLQAEENKKYNETAKDEEEGARFIPFKEVEMDFIADKKDWILDKNNKPGGTLAQRFREVWNLSMDGNLITPSLIYLIIKTEQQESYNNYIKTFAELNEERKKIQKFTGNSDD